MNEIKFNDGNSIPQLGIGTWLLKEKCYEAVLNALKLGYRHIDTAVIYYNDNAIKRAIKDSEIPREELFITTKIWFTDYKKDRLREKIDLALKQLEIDYIDLVLLHKNIGNYKEGWETLVELKKEGKIKSIGVSSFKEKELKKILDMNTVIPAVNQIECNPQSQRNDLIKYMEDNGIKTQVWYPLGHGNKKLINNPIFIELANKYNKTPVQIILRWHIQQKHIVFPKSTNKEHLKENINIFDFELNEEEMQRIKNIKQKKTFDEMPKIIQYPLLWLTGISSFVEK